MLCKPFGHVLYRPTSWKFWNGPWVCACSVVAIGDTSQRVDIPMRHWYLYMRNK